MNRLRTSLLPLLALALSAMAGTSATAQSERPLVEIPEVRRAYVPVSELEALLSGGDRGVLMPRKDFESLYVEARRNAAANPRTAAAIVLQGAEYEGRIVGDRLLIEGTVRLEQLRHGWASFPLELAGVDVESARVGETEARLGRTRAGTDVLLNEGRGPVALDLTLSAPLVRVGSDVTAAVGLPGGAASTLVVDVPAGKRLLLNGAPLERTAPIAEAAAYVVPVGGAEQVRFTVTDRVDGSGGDALLFASTAAGLNVVPGEITWQALTTLEVRGRLLDELMFVVPTELEIAGAESPGLESWRLDDAEDGDGTLVTLRFREPFDGRRNVTLRGVLPVEVGQPWSVPPLVVRGANAHVGRVSVSVPRDVRLETVTTDGARSTATNSAVTTDPFSGENANRRRLVFDVFREDFALRFAARLKEQSFQADTSTVLELRDDRLDLQVAVRVVGRFGATFSVDLELPAAWDVASVTADGATAEWNEIPREAGTRRIRVTLPSPLPPGAEANLVLAARSQPEVWPPSVAPVEVVLPEVRIDATTLEGAYRVNYPDWFEVVPVELSGLDPVPTGDSEVNRSRPNESEPSEQGDHFERLAYEYQNGRIGGRLRVTTRPSRTAVRTLAFSRLDDDALRTHLEVQLDVLGGGLREWKLGLPDSTGDRLQFRVVRSDVGARIVEQSPAPPAAGSIAWSLRFDRRVRGKLVLVVDLDTPAADGANPVPLPTFPSADRHHGYVAFEASDRQSVTPIATDANDQPLWEETPAKLQGDDTKPLAYRPRERVVAVRRFVRPGAKVFLRATRYDRMAVPSAVCQQMHLETAVGAGGVRRHAMEARLSTGSIGTLGIDLGEDARIWSVTIDDEPVEINVLQGIPSVNWPAPLSGEDRDDRQIEVHYETTAADDAAIVQRPPRLLVPSPNGTWIPVEVLRNEWHVHHPSGTSLIGSRGAFQPTRPLPTLSVLGDLQRSLGRVSFGQLGGRLTVIVVLSAVLFLGTLAIRRFGVAWPLVGLGGATCLIVLIGLLLLPAVQQSREAARRGAAPGSVAQSNSAVMYGYEGGGETAEEEYAREPADFDFDGLDDMAAGGEAGGMEAPEFAPPMAEEPRAMEDLAKAEKQPGQPTPKPAPGDGKPGEGQPQRIGESAPEPDPGFDEGGFANDPNTAPGRPADELEARRRIATERMHAYVETAIGDARTEMERLDPDNALNLVRRARVTVEQSTDLEPRSREQLINRLRSNERHMLAQREVIDQRQMQFTERLASLEAEVRLPRGRLSVPLEFQPPPGPQAEFQYVGTAGEQATLAVSIVDHRAARVWCAVATIVTLLVFWFLRRLDLVKRALLVLLAFALSIGVGPLLGVRLQLVMEGVLIGSLLGLGVWLLVALRDAVPEREPETGADNSPSTTAVTATALLLAIATTSTAIAEEPVPNAPERASKPVPSAPNEWTVIVPYEADGNPLEGDRVLVPREAYEALRRTARPDEPLAAGTPHEAVVSTARYVGRLIDDDDPTRARVAVTATFVVEAFGAERTTVTLPIGDVAVRSAGTGGKSLAVRPVKGGLAANVAPGRSTIEITFDVPARVTGPAGRFSLHVPNVPAGTLEFDVPGDEPLIRVDGASNTFRLVNDDAGRTSIVVPFGHRRGGAATVEWRPRTEDRVGDTIVHVESTTTMEPTSAGTLSNVEYVYRVQRGGLTELRFSAPATARVRRISGEDVGGWSFDGEGDERTLRVLLRRRVENATTVIVELFQPNDDEGSTAVLSSFEPRDVVRETGRIAVRVAPRLLAQVVRSEGLQRTRLEEFVPADAPDGTRASASPTRFAFRFAQRPVDLALDVESRPPSAEATAGHEVLIGRYDVRIESRVVFELEGAPRQRVAVRLPDGYVPLVVKAHLLDDWYTRDVGDGRELVVEFTETRSGSVEVVLHGEVRRAPNESAVSIAVPTPVDVIKTNAAVGVFADDGLRVELTEAGDWRRRSPRDLAGATFDELQERGSARAAILLTTEETEPAVASCLVKRAVVRWSGGDVLQLVTVDDDKVSSLYLLKWQFGGASAESFSFTGPASLAGRLDFVNPPLRRVEETDAGNDRVRWTLHATEPVEGQFALLAATVAPPATGRLTGSVPILEAPTEDEAGFEPLDVQNRYAVAVNKSKWRLDLVPNDALESVARRDITLLREDDEHGEDLGRATTLVRLRDPNVVPTWRLVSSVRRRGGVAAVRLAALTTVFDQDGSWRGRGVYHIENRERQFLPLVFPEGVRPLAARVDGRARPIVSHEVGDVSASLIPIPLSTDRKPSFEVEVVFAASDGVGGLERMLGLIERSVQPPAPHVLAPTESAELGVTVSQTTWTVYLPDGLVARPDDDASRNSFAAKRDIDEIEAEEWSYMSSEGRGLSMPTTPTEKSEYNDEDRRRQQYTLGNSILDYNRATESTTRTKVKSSQLDLRDPMPQLKGGQKADAPTKPSGRVPGGEGKESRESRQERAQKQADALEQLNRKSQSLSHEHRFESAFTRRRRGQFEDAEEVAREALDLRPGSGPADAASFEGAGEGELPQGWSMSPTSTNQTLSLEFDLPTTGTAFTFAKSGGDPKLGILVRRADAASRGLGLGWAAAWVVLLVVACVMARRGEAALVTFVLAALTVLGAFAFLFASAGPGFAGLVVFLVGAVALCVRIGRARESTAAN